MAVSTVSRAYFVRSPEVRIPLRRVSMVGSPPLLGREVWGANEAIRARAAELRAERAIRARASHRRHELLHRFAIRGDRAGIEIYHVKGNGWNDIGYNFLVDKYGQVFEGQLRRRRQAGHRRARGRVQHRLRRGRRAR